VAGRSTRSLDCMWAPASLKVTAAAKSAILAITSGITEFRPIAYVGWVLDQIYGVGENAVHLGPGWGVGFYSSDQVPAEAVSEIDGIPFIFEAATSQRLDAATLDFVNGKFVVNEHAI